MTPVRLHPIALSSDLQLNLSTPVADPDVQIRGEGAGAGAGGHQDPEIRGGGGRLPKKFFRPFKPQFGLKIRGGGPPGPSPKSATAQRLPWGQKKVAVVEVERWPFWRGATATGIWI